jgi:hypothetical protein
MIVGKTVEQSFQKCCITNALSGTEEGVLRERRNLCFPNLKSVLEEPEAGGTSEEAKFV